MARPRAKELTERELELMHVFWAEGEMSVAEARQHLETAGRELAYTTVATLVRILCDKEVLVQKGSERPYSYAPLRSFEDVSNSITRDLVQRVFGGARDQLLVQLFQSKKLTAKERAVLEQILREQKK